MTFAVIQNPISTITEALKVKCSIGLSFCTCLRGTMHNTSGTLSGQEEHLELLPAQEHIAVCRMLSPGEIMQTSGRLWLGKYQLCYTTHSKLSPMS